MTIDLGPTKLNGVRLCDLPPASLPVIAANLERDQEHVKAMVVLAYMRSLKLDVEGYDEKSGKLSNWLYRLGV